ARSFDRERGAAGHQGRDPLGLRDGLRFRADEGSAALARRPAHVRGRLADAEVPQGGRLQADPDERPDARGGRARHARRNEQAHADRRRQVTKSVPTRPNTRGSLNTSAESTNWSIAPTSGSDFSHGSVTRSRHASTKRADPRTRKGRVKYRRTVVSAERVTPAALCSLASFSTTA